jgi:hypothetical protein
MSLPQAAPCSQLMDDEYMLYTYKVRACDRKVRAARFGKSGSKQRAGWTQGQGSASLEQFQTPCSSSSAQLGPLMLLGCCLLRPRSCIAHVSKHTPLSMR